MTSEERDHYYRLPKAQQEAYDFYKRQHPNWSHNQLIARAGMDAKLEEVIDQGGQDTDLNNPEIIEQVLIGAKRFLTNAGIYIKEVLDLLNATINNIQNLIMSGVKYIGDKLKDFWRWIGF